MGHENEIVFEDLHGVHEDEAMTVDLDAATKDDGITRTPVEQAADDDAGNDDDIQIDELRSADADDSDDESAADTQTVDKDDASKGGEDDGYSKKVKARITREQRAKLKERNRADYWEQQAKNLAKDSYERDKKSLQREVEQADAGYKQVQADLKRAIEDGNTDDQVRLTTQLSDLKADKVVAQSRLDDLSPDGNVQPFDDKLSPDGPKSTESLSEQWMEDRGDWYRQAGFERQTRLANRIDKEVYADGYRPDSPDYFKELDRRLKEKEPSLYESLDAADDDTGKDDPPDKGRGKQVVAPVSGNESRRQRTSSSKVELTPEDFATMRQFNLDTKDPEVLKEFARNKAQGA